VGNYGELTGFAITLSLFIVVSLQTKGIYRLIGLSACAISFVLSMISTLSGVILLAGLSVSGCLVYYLFLGGIRMRRVFFGSLALLVLVLAAMIFFPSVYERSAFGQFFDKLLNTFSSMQDIVSGNAKDPTARFPLMMQSLNVFRSNPILGVGIGMGADGGNVGDHSSWIDALAWYGVLGAFPYLLLHGLIFRRLWKAWWCERQNALYWSCLLTCALYLCYGVFNIISESTLVALFMYVTATSGQPGATPDNRRKKVAAFSQGYHR
jgi:O-antigen ligase